MVFGSLCTSPKGNILPLWSLPFYFSTSSFINSANTYEVSNTQTSYCVRHWWTNMDLTLYAIATQRGKETIITIYVNNVIIEACTSGSRDDEEHHELPREDSRTRHRAVSLGTTCFHCFHECTIVLLTQKDRKTPKGRTIYELLFLSYTKYSINIWSNETNRLDSFAFKMENHTSNHSYLTDEKGG